MKLYPFPANEARISRRIHTPKKPRAESHCTTEKELNSKAVRILNLGSTQRVRTAPRSRKRSPLKLSCSSLKPRLPRSSASTRDFNDSLHGQRVDLQKPSFSFIPGNHRLNLTCGSFLKQPGAVWTQPWYPSQTDLKCDPTYHSISVKLTLKNRSFIGIQQQSHSAQTD